MAKHLKKIILFLITLVFLYFVFVNININEFISSIKGFDTGFIFPLIISCIISLSFRALCFKQLISKSVPNPSLLTLIHLCLTSAALNIFLPARAGDIFRAFYTGSVYKTDKVKIFGTVMLERIFDVVVIFAFLAWGILVYHNNPLARKLCAFAGILIVCSLLFAFITYKFNLMDKVCSSISKITEKIPFSNFIQKCLFQINKLCNSFFNGFEAIDSPKILFSTILSAVGIWVFECLNFLIVIYGFGYELHWSVSIFIISFIALACMIPSTSIFVGPYQLAVISAFAIYDVSKEAALAISLTEQTIVTIVFAVSAVLFMLKNNISYKQLKEDIKSNLK